MKMTWREYSDGTWHARHYPKGDTNWLIPFSLTVQPQSGSFPWQWEIVRNGEVLLTGETSDVEAARFAAHAQLLKHIGFRPSAPVTLYAVG